MQVGVARIGLAESLSDLDAQERELRAAGCETIYKEQASATASRRPQLQQILEILGEGDVLVVTKSHRWHAPSPTCWPSLLAWTARVRDYAC